MEFVWNNLRDFWLAHYNPFYALVGEGALLIVAVTAAAWYFPFLRQLAGGIVFATIAALVGFKKGEDAEKTREAARDRIKSRPPGDWWNSR